MEKITMRSISKRRNQFKGVCGLCGKDVPVGKGVLVSKTRGRWVIACVGHVVVGDGGRGRVSSGEPCDAVRDALAEGRCWR